MVGMVGLDLGISTSPGEETHHGNDPGEVGMLEP
jgi:hypothetical protein